MVRRTACVAGAGVGAEGLGASVGGIGGLQEGDMEDFHGGGQAGFAHKKHVYQFPGALILDGTLTFLVKGCSQVPKAGFQTPVQRILRCIVEIPHGYDAPLTGRGQGIGQLPEALYGYFPARLRNSRPAVFGWMVVNEERQAAGEAGQQDIARWQDGGILRIQVAGFCTLQLQPGGPVEQSHVYPPRIRRVEVHDTVVQLPERGLLQEGLQYAGVFHF